MIYTILAALVQQILWTVEILSYCRLWVVTEHMVKVFFLIKPKTYYAGKGEQREK